MKRFKLLVIMIVLCVAVKVVLRAEGETAVSIPAVAVSGGQDHEAPTWPNSLTYFLWQRQNFESRKSQEFTTMLDRLLGPGKAAVHIATRWPDITATPATASVEPSQITATIVLDPHVNASDAKFVQDLAIRVLDLKVDPQSRGDRLEIYQLGGTSFLHELLYSPGNLFELIKFFVLILLALVVVSSVVRSTRELSVSLQRIATEKRTHDIDVTLTPKVPTGVNAPQARARIQTTTSGMTLTESALIPTLSQVDSETLAYVLEEESSRSIALFIATLEPDMASKVLASLSPSKQEEVAITLSQMESEPDPREVAQLQAQIHLKLRKILLEKK